jgi:hexosaminidase
VLKRNLDGMAAVKMNVFHWHLSDNQGFRVESRKFPKLQLLGSDGLYYTQAEVREIIAYARDRGIRVVPEFDMPGHSTAWFVGYPELASAPGPYEIERKWGVFDAAMDPTNEQTYKFLDDFVGEMAKLFPDQYFHIGGDEVNGKQWNSNPVIREFMRLHGMKSNEELQTYFVQRVQKIVSKHGKTMVGWDEVLSPGSPNSILIQSWRGQDALAAAAKQGYRGLLSYGYYLDLNWSAARHYEVDPFAASAANLGAEEKKRILGGEACIWSEYVSPENIDSRIWPRAAVVAERLWSPQEVRDPESMYQRMDEVSRRLDFIGLTHNANYRPMLERIAGSRDGSAVRVLADVVEPVKDYAREELAITPATSASPLYRVIDAARPESEVARKADQLVTAFLSASASKEQTSDLRNLLVSWKDNDVKLEALADRSFLLKEVLPISQSLSIVGTDGLQAMDYLANRETAPVDWADKQLAFLKEASKPDAQLLLVAIPPVERLVRASSGQVSAQR